MEFILVIYIYAGVFAKGDSVALESIPMKTMEACEKAGNKASGLTQGSAKEFRFVCLKNQ